MGFSNISYTARNEIQTRDPRLGKAITLHHKNLSQPRNLGGFCIIEGLWNLTISSKAIFSGYVAIDGTSAGK